MSSVDWQDEGWRGRAGESPSAKSGTVRNAQLLRGLAAWTCFPQRKFWGKILLSRACRRRAEVVMVSVNLRKWMVSFAMLRRVWLRQNDILTCNYGEGADATGAQLVTTAPP